MAFFKAKKTHPKPKKQQQKTQPKTQNTRKIITDSGSDSVKLQ